MTTYLLASASVHTAATACDYLAERLIDDDTVMILGVTEPGTTARDIGDAIWVVPRRPSLAKPSDRS